MYNVVLHCVIENRIYFYYIYLFLVLMKNKKKSILKICKKMKWSSNLFDNENGK